MARFGPGVSRRRKRFHRGVAAGEAVFAWPSTPRSRNASTRSRHVLDNGDQAKTVPAVEQSVDDGEFGLAAFESQGCEGSDEEGAAAVAHFATHERPRASVVGQLDWDPTWVRDG